MSSTSATPSTPTSTPSSIPDDLQTPTLDKELSNLLHSITEHGGYAYSSMTTLAASGDFRAAEAAREMAWEQLHSGPWHSVLPIWRDAYSMACLHVAKIQYRNGEVKEALRVLDLGLIMGGTVLRNDLEMAVEVVNGKARVLRGERENGDRRVVAERIDEAEVRFVLDSVYRICQHFAKFVVKFNKLEKA